MAMVINSNIQSLNAQRHLNNSLQAQNTATERLSSGLRINSAKDDAAGLAIANRMTSQIQGLNQAVRNANDGAALIQTAEGGLEEVTNILQRMRELSIQSANGTYDTGNRDTLNAEIDQLQLEIDRIGETTSFNGLNILDGSKGEILLQVGENANQTIAFEIGEVSTKELGTGSNVDVTGGTSTAASLLAGLQVVAGTAAGSEGVEINGIDIDVASTGTANYTLADALQDINGDLNGSVIAGSLVEINTTTEGDGKLSGTDKLTIDVTANDNTVTTFEIENTTSLKELVDAINEKSNGTVKAEIDSDGNFLLSGAGNATVELTHSTPADMDSLIGENGATSGTAVHARLTLEEGTTTTGITVDFGTSTTANSVLKADAIGLDERTTAGQLNSFEAAAAVANSLSQGDIIINDIELGNYDNTEDYAQNGATNDAYDVAAYINQHSAETGVVASAIDIGTAGTATAISLTSVDGTEISIEYNDDNAANAEALTGLKETNITETKGANVASIDITTVAGAQKAIEILDDAIAQVSDTRGQLGAVSNRLDYTTRNLSNISENASSARSAIMDADFAAESANLSRAQVLQQAGNAMLAQANARPQQVLSLIQ